MNEIVIKKQKRKVSAGRKVFVALNTIFLVLISLTFVLPYMNILGKAFNESKDTMLGGLTFWPRKWTWDNFNVVLNDTKTWSGLLVSVLRVVIGSAISLFINYSTAYVLLRKGLRFKKAIVLFMILPNYISGGLVSQYVIYAKLGVFNTFWVYVLPNAFTFYNMIIIRTYLDNVSESLRESARLDGAGEFTILFKIMLPLSMPIVATMLLWSAVGHWNDWSTTLYFIRDKSLYTLAYNLQLAVKEADILKEMIQDAIESGRPLGSIDTDITGESLQAAQLIFTTLPIVCLYPFFQRYFMQGIMIGGVKE